MDVSSRGDSCELVWNPRDLTLDDLAKFMSLIAELHSEVAVPYVTDELFSPGSNVVPSEPPLVASISMGSPLVTQLLAGAGGVLPLGMVAYILKNPDRLADFLPVLRQRWHRGNRIALEEKLQYIETRDRIQARGRSIERFEGVYRTRELRRTRARRHGRSPRQR
jgi:hypothetical protein